MPSAACPRLPHVLLKSILVITLACPCLANDESKRPGGVSDDKATTALRRLMDESLQWNELFATEGTATPMELRVALRWANNARGSEDGMTVLYIAQGRPEAVCCIYPWEQSLVHEFDSLSRGTLIGKRDGLVVWRPAAAGLTFKPIPDADTPAESPAARLRQMKILANLFSSTMLGWRANSSDRESLRLLPQPLYRYESKRGDVVDGAVFAFVQGTDPESLLLLEAFRKGDQFEWQFAFVRRTSGELEGRYKDSVVWHVDRHPVQNDYRSIHFTLPRPLKPEVLNELRKAGDLK